jgi:flagellar hook-length control protein FliK
VDPTAQRLPSGLIVPDTTVMDQVLTHLSLQRRLASTTVHLRLNPQELGELRMEIKVEQDNIKAHIIAQNPQAQEMIDRHLPRLREALELQGLNLQQVSVTLAGGDHADSRRFHDNLHRHLPSQVPLTGIPPSSPALSGPAMAQPATTPAAGLNVVA